MKLLLIQPPIQDFYDTDIRLQPLGLAYLKAAVCQHVPQIEVKIKDYHHGWGRHTLPIPQELEYLKEYYLYPDKSPFSTFYHYYHFGARFEEIEQSVAEERPDMVCISSLFSPYYREALRCAEIIKAGLNIPVVMGGSHVSAVPKLMLAHPSVDFVIRGEGERALVEFLNQWMGSKEWRRVPNLGYKEDGRMIFNEIEESYSIEELPIPDLSDLAPDQYLFENKPLSFLITSRSCPHHCTFCSVHQTFGRKYRRRSVEHVLKEIKQRYQEGTRVFDFEDDNLTFYKDEMRELCRRLIDLFPRNDVQFVAMNGISYLSLDDELLILMKRAGFTHLNLALVSSDTTVRETTKRPHTIQKYLEVVQKASELGFRIVSYQILGLPNESLDSMIQTLVFGVHQPVLLGASMFYLTPDSPMAKNFPLPSEEDIFKSRLTAMAIETESFDREDLYTLFITTRIINFFKGLEFYTSEISLQEALCFAERQGGRSAVGAQVFRQLVETRKLYAQTKQGLCEIPRFRIEVFAQVWDRIEFIETQQGRRIYTGLKFRERQYELFEQRQEQVLAGPEGAF